VRDRESRRREWGRVESNIQQVRVDDRPAFESDEETV
jgi:hypothetical protein